MGSATELLAEVPAPIYRLRNTGPRWLVGLAVATLILVAATAQIATAAETSSTDTGTPALEEVLVTARYTRETVQQTPISMAALSAERLAEDGIVNLVDVAQTTSSTSFIPGGSDFGKSMGALIRGVGQTDFIFAEQPGVGIYIDDVYFSTLFGSSLEMGDIDRVEVLKGPQGTLFGRNNEGGAVRVFMQKPMGDDSGFAEVGYGDYNQRRVKASFDARLTDNLFVRITGSSRSQDGYVDQIDFACAHPTESGNIRPITTQGGCVMGAEGSEDVKYGRAAIRWLPLEGLEINLEGDITIDNGSPGPDRTVFIQPVGTALQVANTAINVPHYGIPVDGRFITSGFYQTYATDPTYSNPLTGVYENPVNDVTSSGYSGTVDWDTAFGVHVKFIEAFRKYDGQFAFKQGGAPIWVAGDWTLVHHDQTSEELRISGQAFNHALDWVIGGYYFESNELLSGPVDISTLSPVVGFPFVFNQNDPFSDKSASGFAHGVYHVTDKLGLEAGVRYTHDSSHVVFDHTLTLLGVPFFPITPGSVSDSHVDPKVSLQYQWSDTAMTYASVSRGYRQGGFNPRPLSPAQVTTFAPEELWAYELGSKTEWFERRLRLNPALYLSDYTNIQQQLFSVDKTGTPALLYGNVGHVQISGVELDIDAKPTNNWSFDASVGDLRYHVISLGAAAGIAGGPTLHTMPIGVPKFKGNAGAQYSYPLLGGTVALRADFTYQSHVWFDAPNAEISSQNPYGLMNLRLSWNSANGLWESSLLATNVLGREYYTSLNNNISLWGTVEGQVGKPREILFSVRRSFGGKDKNRD